MTWPSVRGHAVWLSMGRSPRGGSTSVDRQAPYQSTRAGFTHLDQQSPDLVAWLAQADDRKGADNQRGSLSCWLPIAERRTLPRYAGRASSAQSALAASCHWLQEEVCCMP